MFNSPIDVANRALQHLGARRIASFTDNSKEAAEISFAYDKLRKTELERNVWEFCIRRAWIYPVNSTSMGFTPKPWVATEFYRAGSIVSYLDAFGTTQTWIATAYGNVGEEPDVQGNSWVPFFGSPMVNQFIPQPTGTVPSSSYIPTYNRGDIVYLPLGPGVNVCYYSLVEGNQETPNVPDVWAAYVNPFQNGFIQPTLLTNGRIVGQYAKGDIVQGSDLWYYMSQIDINQNNDPTLSPKPFNLLTSYAAAAVVAGSDGHTYQSLVSSNIGHDPTTDNGIHWEDMNTPVPWTPAFDGGISSNLWLQLAVNLVGLEILYPLGSGPVEQNFNRNIFLLPSNFLRRAPQDPKAGSRTFLGSPTGLTYDDYLIEAKKYLTSRSPFPIPLRYCADVTDVTLWPSMFAEGLSARVAIETCETITQSREKISIISGDYAKFMTEARTVGAILTGSDEPPEDDWITTRI